MFRLLVLIVFCGMLVFVLSDSNGTDCIFEFLRFETLGDSKDNIVDYTGQEITPLVENNQIHLYITGPLVVKETLDTSFTVSYTIQKYTNFNTVDVATGFDDVCFFQENIYKTYLLPIAGKHNNFPPAADKCPIEPFSAKLSTAWDSSELMAPSQLDDGIYYCKVLFTKNFVPVGGFIANFTTVRD